MFRLSICSLVFPSHFGEEDFGYYRDYCSQLRVNNIQRIKGEHCDYQTVFNR